METLKIPDCNGEELRVAKSLVLMAKACETATENIKMRDWISSDFGIRMHEKVKWN